MKKYQTNDVVGELQKIVDKTVCSYKEDFAKDVVCLRKAKPGTVYIWMAREHGTNLMYESTAWIDNTLGNAACHAYLPEKKTDAYFVEVRENDSEAINGFIYTIDKEWLQHSIDKNASEIGAVSVLLNGDMVDAIAYPEYKKNHRELFEKWEGIYESSPSIRFEPKDADRIQQILDQNATERRNAKCIKKL